MTSMRKKFIAFAVIVAVLLLAVGVLWRTPLLALWQQMAGLAVLSLGLFALAVLRSHKSQD